ncbi:hypothetical protein ACF064_01625 [Streptomyces sp. NPDC015492]|uniref:hypothetical protein n=1 Tax=Streptomyces sp. NPDC015492 TaxID=3364958 RepID=UPI0036FA34EE
MHSHPGADEIRARVLMLAAMRRRGAWNRTVDTVVAIEPQVSTHEGLPSSPGEGRGQ